MLMQLEKHAKWSEDKHGAVMIHSRYSDTGTSFIRSTSGKEIWRQLVEVDSAKGCVSEDDLLNGLHKQFGESVPFTTLKQDLVEFLNKLIRERIIRAADND